MRTLQELGEAVANRRRTLGLKQLDIAKQAGVTAESLSRFERGRTTEFGSRKLLAVLAAVGMELDLVEAANPKSISSPPPHVGGGPSKLNACDDGGCP